MRIEIDVRNPQHFGEVLFHCYRKAMLATGHPRHIDDWEFQPQVVKMFWGAVATNVIKSGMGAPL